MSKEEQLKQEAETIETIQVAGRLHAVKPSNCRRRFPNYMGTGKGGCGVLKPGQTLKEFRNEWVKSQLKFR